MCVDSAQQWCINFITTAIIEIVWRPNGKMRIGGQFFHHAPYGILVARMNAIEYVVDAIIFSGEHVIQRDSLPGLHATYDDTYVFVMVGGDIRDGRIIAVIKYQVVMFFSGLSCTFAADIYVCSVDDKVSFIYDI